MSDKKWKPWTVWHRKLGKLERASERRRIAAGRWWPPPPTDCPIRAELAKAGGL